MKSEWAWWWWAVIVTGSMVMVSMVVTGVRLYRHVKQVRRRRRRDILPNLWS